MKRLLLTLTVAVLPAIGTLAQSLYEQAEEAFNRYDFDTAEELLDKYAAQGRRKRAKTTDDDLVAHPYRPGVTLNRVDELRRRIELGRGMLDRVERVMIVDTLTVERDNFFSHYRLDPSSGRPELSDRLDEIGVGENAIAPMYVTEKGDTYIWVDNVDDPEIAAGHYHMMRSDRLADGSREQPEEMFDRAGVFGDDEPGQLFAPWLMADGVTLYFAADGPQSLGGLDIFLTRDDGEGGFLQPSNVGMPYNSPANDFMMAIDEVTGAGWWATDRDTDEEHVTIYVFKPAELRQNLSPDTEDIAAIALLETPIFADDSVRADVMRRIDEAAVDATPREPEFRFALPNGRVVTSRSGFHSSQARSLVADWLKASDELRHKREALDALRRSRGSAFKIREIENQLPELQERRKQAANRIVEAEGF